MLPSKVIVFAISSCPSAFTIAAVSPTWSFPFSVVGTGPNGSGEMVRSGSGLPIEFEVTTPSIGACVYKFPHYPMFLTGSGGYTGGTDTGTLSSGSGCPSSVTIGFEVLLGPEFFVTN